LITDKPSYEELEHKIKVLEKQVAAHQQAEEALEESEHPFRAFLDNLGDAAYETDSLGNVTYANKMGEIITGLPLKDIIGKSFLPLFAGEHQKTAIDVFQRTLDGESPEYELTFINGTICHFKNEPLRNEQGKIVGVFGIARDITNRKRTEEALHIAHDHLERRVEQLTVELTKKSKQMEQEIQEKKEVSKELKESEERYRTIFQGAAEGVIVADIETKKFRYVNPAMSRMLGYTEEELVRMRVDDVHPKEALDMVILEFEAQAQGEKTLAESIPCLRKDGATIYADIKTTNMVIDGKECNVGFFTDITKRKHAEQELRERETALEIQAEELQEVNTALRVLLRQRDKDKIELEEKVFLNVRELVMPQVEKLKKTILDARQKAYLGVLESNLNEIISPFAHRLSSKYSTLTPTEIQMAFLIRDGKTTKEIAELLNLSGRTVESHRQSIRMKMGIRNRKANLRSHLLSM